MPRQNQSRRPSQNQNPNQNRKQKSNRRRSRVATKTDTDKLVEQLGGMTVLDLVELKNKLEEEWGVTAAAPVAVAAAGAAPAGDGAGAAEEKTAFDVVLTGAGDKKIQVIKVVRAV